MPSRTFTRCTLATSAALALVSPAFLQTTGRAAPAQASRKERRPVEVRKEKASPPVDVAFFEREVRPILEKSCLGCHGVGSQLGGLDLRSRESALKGGVRGAAFAPGKADQSLLYHFITGRRTPVMPPTGKLPPAQIEVLRRWLDGGAPWPSGRIEDAQKQVWWSFKPPARPPVPQLKHAEWVRNPIDAFVLRKLRAEGLRPSPPATRRELIRRAYLDLIGLPPTPEKIAAFEKDPDPRAWEKVVDHLLASPHYGERWGRHWLDLVRYADSSGFEGDKDRPNAWRYRDYVIRAFNQDRPYDQFIREQIAGDEIRPGDTEALIATGYLACGVEDFAMVKLPQTRADELDDLVSTTGSAFLGLTVGCARCHDHKYDPVTQKDYYRLQALFAPTERKEVDIPTPEERRAADERNREIDRELAPHRERLEALRVKGTQAAIQGGNAKPNDEQIAAALPEAERKTWNELQATIKGIEAKRPVLPKALIVTDKAPKWEPVHLHIRGDANHKGEVVPPGFIVSLPGGAQVVTAEAATPATTGRRRALADWLASRENPLTARVWVNRVWRQHFGRGLVNTPSNFGVNGELPSHPELLDYLASSFVAGDRGQESGIGGSGWTQLSPTPRWGTPHPDAAPRRRQTAAASSSRGSHYALRNTHYAGAPRPPAPNPQPPTPNLAWSTKALHRLMLLSATYQQSSRPDDARMKAGMAKDPENRHYWRMPVRRLEAEAIRDSILTVAGTLNREMGGPPVYPPVDPSLRADTFQGVNWPEGEDSFKTRRRSVYVKVKRSLLLPQLEVFDCPEITSSVAQRNVTITPLQALTLLNDPLIVRQAGLFAERLRKEVGDEPRRQVERAYQLALGRTPTPAELQLSLRFLAKRPLADFCHAVLNLNEFIYVP